MILNNLNGLKTIYKGKNREQIYKIVPQFFGCAKILTNR